MADIVAPTSSVDPKEAPAWSSFYDDLDGTLEEAWRLLEQGATDRRAAFHTPVVATLRLDGRPAARTVVLRAVDRERRLLRFHTDRRSRKFEEIASDPRIALHFYDPGAKVQLCVDGRAERHETGAVADAAWRASRPMSRACYRVAPGPGTEVGHPSEAAIGRSDDPEHGRENFSAIAVTIDRIEWLYLTAKGHRRARFDWQCGRFAGTWIVP